MDFSPEALNKRYHELSKRRDTILKKATPLRDKRDELAAAHADEREKHDAAIVKAEHGLYDIDQERAMIARALGSKLQPEA